jgi:hypothetical protein
VPIVIYPALRQYMNCARWDLRENYSRSIPKPSSGVRLTCRSNHHGRPHQPCPCRPPQHERHLPKQALDAGNRPLTSHQDLTAFRWAVLKNPFPESALHALFPLKVTTVLAVLRVSAILAAIREALRFQPSACCVGRAYRLRSAFLGCISGKRNARGEHSGYGKRCNSHHFRCRVPGCLFGGSH